MTDRAEVHERAVELSDMPHATLALLACGVEIERDHLLTTLRDVLADLELIRSGLRFAIANETVAELERRLDELRSARIRTKPSDAQRVLTRVDKRIGLTTAALRKYQQ